MTEIELVGLVGSLRRASHSASVMRSLPGLLPEAARLSEQDIGHLPHYDEDLKADGTPDDVLAVAEALRRADGVVIVTPEYNRSFPGVLKNVLDWVSKEPEAPFRGKPVAVISQSPGALGGILANYHLRQVLNVMGAEFLTGAEVAINTVAGKIGDGMVTDQPTRDVLSKEMARLVDRIRG